MKIPRKVKIGAHHFDIKVVDPPIIDDDHCGECEREQNTIFIRKGMCQSQTEETLLHEIIHAIDVHLPEDKVDRLGFVLYQVLRDNKLNFAE